MPTINLTAENAARARAAADEHLATRDDATILALLAKAEEFVRGGALFREGMAHLKKVRGGALIRERARVAGEMALEQLRAEARRRGL